MTVNPSIREIVWWLSCFTFLFGSYSNAVAEDQIIAKGIIVYSPNSLGKDFAVGKIYTEIEDHSRVLQFIGRDGGKTQAMKQNVFAVLELNSFTENLSSAEQLEMLKQDVKALEKLKLNYMSINPLVEELTIDANSRISRFNNGMFLIDGVWQNAPSMEKKTSSVEQAENGPPTNSIKTKTGRILKNPTVSSVNGEMATIMHSTGFAKVRITELPEEFVKKWLPETAIAETKVSPNNRFRNGQSNTAKITHPPKFLEWDPANATEAIDCAVIIEGDRGSGSGFLCHDDNVTYIYTNVHVLAGNSRIRIKDRNGKEFKDFSYIETAAAGFDNGDIVRLALSKPVDKALRLSASGQTPDIGSKIIAIGNSPGSGVLRPLEGEVEGIGPTRIEITAEIVQGNSGGPILNDKFEVIGISSFGELRVDIWSEGTEFDKVRRFGLRPSGVEKWDRYSGLEFLQVAFLYDQLVADIALVSVLDSIKFTENGLKYNRKADVIAGMNANEVVNSFRGHVFADALLQFNDKLDESGSTGDVGLDSRNLIVSYGKLVSQGQIGMSTRRRSMMSRRSVPFYVRKKIEDSDLEIETIRGVGYRLIEQIN